LQYFILDDLLPEIKATNVIEYFKTASWNYGNKPDDTCPPFWKSTLKNTPIWNIFEDKVHSLWNDVYISSIFANGQTKGLDSTPHFDKSSRGELDILLGDVNNIDEYKDYTFMYNVCMEKKWGPAWGGETVLLTDDDHTGKVFVPKYNRAIVIDGSILHYGKGPSHIYFSMRINVVCRLLMKETVFNNINN
tara:strand:+ start:77 stop:649 length:573 start_codon:yes stop_codon:yes gene_type:complete